MKKIFQGIAFSFLVSHLASAAGPNQLLFVGSSSMVYWQASLAKDFPRFETHNLGVGGKDYPFITENASKWTAGYPNAKQIVIYSGDNDINYGSSPQQVAADFEKAAQALYGGMKQKPELYVLSIKPCTEPERAKRLATSAARKLLSVDHDLSLESEKLAELGNQYLRSWKKIGNGKEFLEAERAMDAAAKEHEQLDAEWERLSHQ